MHHFTSKKYREAAYKLDGQENLDDHFFASIRALPSFLKLSLDPSSNSIQQALESNDQAFYETVEKLRIQRGRWQNDLGIGFGLLLLVEECWEKKMPMEDTLFMYFDGNLDSYVKILCGLVQ